MGILTLREHFSYRSRSPRSRGSRAQVYQWALLDLALDAFGEDLRAHDVVVRTRTDLNTEARVSYSSLDPAPRAEVPAPWREADSAAAREDAVDVADVDVSGWGRTVSGLVGDLDSGLVRAPGLGDLDDPVRFVESPDKAAELVGGAPGRS